MKPIYRLVPAGMALIGVTYGLARFAYGLFLPDMRADVGLSPALAGAIGGGSYAGYCIAIVTAALLSTRFGPRPIACLAGVVATGGMALIALGQTPAVLAAGVLIAGMSTGFSSPPMADAVARLIDTQQQPRANALINSGTCAGIVISGPAALLAMGQWREAYWAFTVMAFAATVWIAAAAPRRGETRHREPEREGDALPWRALLRPRAAALMLAAAAMGFASAVYWTFAGELVVQRQDLAAGLANLVWVVIGIGGLAGAAAGDLVQRFGINAVHGGSLLALAVASCLLVLVSAGGAGVLVSAMLFGAAYIMLTGVYLVWGVRVYADRPAIGIGLPFLMIAVGQALGSPVAGQLIEAFGYRAAFVAFALVAVLTTTAGWGSESGEATERAVGYP
ncbi:MFS transporter [Arhodomonas sp. AD133]|uniref:MFS transporter n=1 Tax=Arhodomonas sp. AD133 TaxID=3415009 RepID=UPI003EB9C785